MSKEYLESLDYVWYNYYTEEELSEDEINEFVKHLKIVETALHRLKTIDNAEPSEALKELNILQNALDKYLKTPLTEYVNLFDCINTIKQYILKAQQPKQYLKWEDLEFGVPTTNDVTIKVKMGDTQYRLSLRTSFSDVKSVVLRDNDLKPILHLYEKEKQFFNDLHLERVEE